MGRTMDQPGPPVVRANGRGWKAFFLLLIVLASAGAVFPLIFNLRQQLTSGKLQDAQARWRENGPRSYDLEYTFRLDNEPQALRHLVIVREGQVVLEVVDGEAIYLDPAFGLAMGLSASAVGQVSRPKGIEVVFNRMEEVLQSNASASRRNFTSAQFDPKDGHPRRFVHRVRDTGQREEWYLRILPPGGSADAGMPRAE
jgi:hypothetical protein